MHQLGLSQVVPPPPKKTFKGEGNFRHITPIHQRSVLVRTIDSRVYYYSPLLARIPSH